MIKICPQERVAMLLWSLIEGYRQLDDAMFADSDNIAMKILSYITRFTATSWIMVSNHEIGGYGARAKNLI